LDAFPAKETGFFTVLAGGKASLREKTRFLTKECDRELIEKASNSFPLSHAFTAEKI